MEDAQEPELPQATARPSKRCLAFGNLRRRTCSLSRRSSCTPRPVFGCSRPEKNVLESRTGREEGTECHEHHGSSREAFVLMSDRTRHDGPRGIAALIKTREGFRDTFVSMETLSPTSRSPRFSPPTGPKKIHQSQTLFSVVATKNRRGAEKRRTRQQKQETQKENKKAAD